MSKRKIKSIRLLALCSLISIMISSCKTVMINRQAHFKKMESYDCFIDAIKKSKNLKLRKGPTKTDWYYDFIIDIEGIENNYLLFSYSRADKTWKDHIEYNLSFSPQFGKISDAERSTLNEIYNEFESNIKKSCVGIEYVKSNSKK